MGEAEGIVDYYILAIFHVFNGLYHYPKSEKYAHYIKPIRGNLILYCIYFFFQYVSHPPLWSQW